MNQVELREEENRAIAETEDAFKARQEAFLELHTHLSNHPDITVEDHYLEKFEQAELRFKVANAEMNRIATEIINGLRQI